MKILYLHNKENWAIHNVGRLWLADIPGVEVTYRNIKADDSIESFDNYDYVWFGLSTIYFDFNYDLRRSIISIHDPFEIFPQEMNWKKRQPFFETLELLKKARAVVTASSEMLSILNDNLINAELIPTKSTIPCREPDAIVTTKCHYSAVCGFFPRKNLSLMEQIMEECGKIKNTRFDMKLGSNNPLPENEYIDFLDRHEVYICTSFQEGGPIASMDAMNRGNVVITTPVGQMPEIIDDGINGFICTNKKEFIDRMKMLAGDLSLLQEMRLKSMHAIKERRQKNNIKKTTELFIKALLQN